MPDTLVGHVVMAGDGMEEDLGIAYNYALLHVTDVGDARFMDMESPGRLFQLGWFAFGEGGAGAWDYFPTPTFGIPIWIVFENMFIPDYTTLDFVTELYCGIVRYHMIGSATADLTFWHT